MITINTLIKLIENYEEILRQTESFGYVNLRLFCSYSEEDKHELNFLASFDHTKRQAITYDKDINEVLGGLLETEVCLWGEGASGLKAGDYTEADDTPLLDMERTINYFIDTLIPYSTDEEPVEKNREYAQQYWRQKTTTKTQISRAKGYNTANPQIYNLTHFQPRISSLFEQFSEALSSLSDLEKGKIFMLLITRNGFSLEKLQQVESASDHVDSQPPAPMVLSDS